MAAARPRKKTLLVRHPDPALGCMPVKTRHPEPAKPKKRGRRSTAVTVCLLVKAPEDVLWTEVKTHLTIKSIPAVEGIDAANVVAQLLDRTLRAPKRGVVALLRKALGEGAEMLRKQGKKPSTKGKAR